MEETKQEEWSADNLIVSRILRVYYEEAKRATCRLINSLESLPLGQRDALLRRWMQIEELTRQAFVNGICTNVQRHTHQFFDLPLPIKDR